ncbi:hypothetical protein GCM10009721_12070 [Terrabacter tumescens]|uniref:Transcription regulator TrmB N-terminal domain-containing protein n=1 Tax=Terrabacter tumescens TaxID=60443 RepID=A0ABQ2HQC8_9MICO|nr:hypothetical protein GCM10009721_12070 [Terrabacter tumescens]
MDLDDDAAAVYRAMLDDHTQTVADLAIALSLSRPRVRKALDTLADTALLQPAGSDPLVLVPSPPRVGMARLVAEAEVALAAQARRVAAVRALMETMAADHDAHLHREALVHHRTVEGVRDRLQELALEARTECVSLNPGRAHKPDAMAASKPLNQLALERGVAIRAVYQDSFRHDPATLDYARWLTDMGGQARTMPECRCSSSSSARSRCCRASSATRRRARSRCGHRRSSRPSWTTSRWCGCWPSPSARRAGARRR